MKAIRAKRSSSGNSARSDQIHRAIRFQTDRDPTAIRFDPKPLREECQWAHRKSDSVRRSMGCALNRRVESLQSRDAQYPDVASGTEVRKALEATLLDIIRRIFSLSLRSLSMRSGVQFFLAEQSGLHNGFRLGCVPM
jgi:hypothetical protein